MRGKYTGAGPRGAAAVGSQFRCSIKALIELKNSPYTGVMPVNGMNPPGCPKRVQTFHG